MKKIIASSLLFLGLLTFGCQAYAVEGKIERVEPAFWWVGMKSDKLELMVHGEHIADFAPQLQYPGVHIESVARVENPNYLFIDLRIAADAQAGKFDIVFHKGAETATYSYALLQREKGSAQRSGFTSADVILNLMPDRFANGNPANDDVPGYDDKANRADLDNGRHGGDIKGIVDHLDYIAAMGYTMIWPTPLTESNQKRVSYHGYAATDTYKIDPRYGSNEEYRDMVALAKAKGLGVIQDIVLNHIGSGHWWMKDMPMKDWISYDGKFVQTHHMHTTVADPYASQEDKRNFTGGWFGPDMPDMNQRNPFVATYEIQNAIWWVEYAGLSGIRVDTYGYSDTDFLSEWSRRLTDEYPNLNIVGEEWSSNPVVVSNWQKGKLHANGYQSYLPSLMDFPLNETLRRALTDKEAMFSGLVDLYADLVNDVLYPDPSNLVVFEGNHDENRLYSVLGEDLGLTKMALAYVLTTRGIPQLYYGTEVLMTSKMEGRHDGAARQDFPGGWAGDKINAFTGVGLSAQQKEAQDFVRRLLNWRKTEPVVHHGKLMHYAPENGMYVYFRYDGGKAVMVILNKNKADTRLELARFHEMLGTHSSANDVMSGKTYELREALMVPARSPLILELK
ncbi:MAG: glycoside hydrolase family 13 protein [Burkholderiaceae bacterium]|nr:glycoside hydrolase family 13 protein [Burkholderiaceae bacterium]